MCVLACVLVGVRMHTSAVNELDSSNKYLTISNFETKFGFELSNFEFKYRTFVIRTFLQLSNLRSYV